MKKIFLLLMALGTTGFAADPVEFQVGEFSFERPANWTWVVPGSPMRKAQLMVPADGTTPGEVVFFHFGPGEGGGVQANVTRWLGQFENGTSDQKAESIGKTKVTFVKAEGTFLSGMPGQPSTPMTGYSLRGAILESAGGDVFVKMTGPEAVVKSAEASFEKMVRQSAAR